MVDIFYDDTIGRRNIKSQFVGFTDFLCKLIEIKNKINSILITIYSR